MVLVNMGVAIGPECEKAVFRIIACESAVRSTLFPYFAVQIQGPQQFGENRQGRSVFMVVADTWKGLGHERHRGAGVPPLPDRRKILRRNRERGGRR